MMRAALLLLALLFSPLQAAIRVMPLATPAAAGSSTPLLARGRDGAPLLTWSEKHGKRTAVRLSRLTKNGWSTPVTIVERDDLFTNGADLPGVFESEDGILFAWWLQRGGSSKFAYDVMISTSGDGGRSWRSPVPLHDDHAEAEHGFVSAVGAGKSRVSFVWLNGASSHGHGGAHGATSLRQRFVSSDLKRSAERVLDDRVCDCCNTGIASTRRGALVAYRDRSGSEMRDISLLRLDGPPAAKGVGGESWKIAGCPVNGPQLDALGDRVVIAWYSAAADRPRVRAAWSNDGGATFTAPVDLSVHGPEGRVEAVVVDEKRSLILWIEGGALRARLVNERGSADDAIVTTFENVRASGFPRALMSGDSALVVWTDPRAAAVRAARLTLR